MSEIKRVEISRFQSHSNNWQVLQLEYLCGILLEYCLCIIVPIHSNERFITFTDVIRFERSIGYKILILASYSSYNIIFRYYI